MSFSYSVVKKSSTQSIITVVERRERTRKSNEEHRVEKRAKLRKSLIGSKAELLRMQNTLSMQDLTELVQQTFQTRHDRFVLNQPSDSIQSLHQIKSHFPFLLCRRWSECTIENVENNLDRISD